MADAWRGGRRGRGGPPRRRGAAEGDFRLYCPGARGKLLSRLSAGASESEARLIGILALAPSYCAPLSPNNTTVRLLQFESLCNRVRNFFFSFFIHSPVESLTSCFFISCGVYELGV